MYTTTLVSCTANAQGRAGIDTMDKVYARMRAIAVAYAMHRAQSTTCSTDVSPATLYTQTTKGNG